jgi:hypothetical protein
LGNLMPPSGNSSSCIIYVNSPSPEFSCPDSHMSPERRYKLASKMPEVEPKLSTLEFEELALAVLFFRSILACSSLPAASIMARASPPYPYQDSARGLHSQTVDRQQPAVNRVAKRKRAGDGSGGCPIPTSAARLLDRSSSGLGRMPSLPTINWICCLFCMCRVCFLSNRIRGEGRRLASNSH